MSVKLTQNDCIEEMRSMERKSIDCIITSPPYNVNLGHNKFKKDGYNSHNDDMPYDEYLGWMSFVFSECYQVLKEDGRICINIGDGKNGKVTTHSDFWNILKNNDFIPITTIIWNKRTTSNRAAWGSFMSPSCPSFPSQMEYILVAGKSEKLLHKGKSTISKEDFISWTNPIWEFKPETKLKEIGHPAAYPVELPYRCIQLFTYENDMVLDPFAGSGTTGIACIRANRNFIGIEKDYEYCKVATKRINAELTQGTLF